MQPENIHCVTAGHRLDAGKTSPWTHNKLGREPGHLATSLTRRGYISPVHRGSRFCEGRMDCVIKSYLVDPNLVPAV